ncbi:MAG TPA: hypothetical protein VFB16_09740 [Bauldia sp.]|nr:hypothetical protein [Bauldia sp.]
MSPLEPLSSLFGDLETAVTKILKQNGGMITSFARAQLQRLAKHAELMKKAALAGAFESLDDAAHFAKSLEEMAQDFIRALGALILVTLEKVWNAIVKIVWGAINGALGALGPLPLPHFPKP